VFGILGPNGAGKTTLLKLLAGLLLPDAGTIIINGRDIAESERHTKESVGYVVNEERSFYWRLTGRENLSFFGTLEDLSGKVLSRRIEEVLELVGLTADADRMVKDYSTGMRRRLAIARGLLRNPSIILFDEPTATLDPKLSSSLRTFIRETLSKKEGKAVCLATHNLFEAETVCDRIAILHKGRLLACGAPPDLRSRVADQCVVELTVSDSPGEEELTDAARQCGWAPLSFVREPGRIRMRVAYPETRRDLSPLVNAVSLAGFSVFACLPVEPSLEEVFRRFTEEYAE